MATVEIILGIDGSIKVEGNGLVGESCKEATEFLDKLFGEAEETTYKDEFYNREMTVDALPSGHCG